MTGKAFGLLKRLIKKENFEDVSKNLDNEEKLETH